MQATLLSLAVMFVQATPASAQPSPPPAASSSPLPEIGRVKTDDPACPAIHELIVPAYAAVRTADEAFDRSVPALASYAEAMVHERHQSGFEEVTRKMYLSRIGEAAATQLQALQRIAKALADPTLHGPPGSAVDAERRHLEALYAVEADRTLALHEFWVRNAAAAGRQDVDEQVRAMLPTGYDVPDALTPGVPSADGAPEPLPIDRTVFGQPVLRTDIAVAARGDITTWAGKMTMQVKRGEVNAQSYFLPLARRCDTAANAPTPAARP